MSPHTLYTIILIIIIAGFAFDQWINYLNTTTLSNILPDTVKGFYDEQTYSKQQDYDRVNYKFGLISDILSFLVILAMLFFGGFAWVDGIARSFSSSAILQAIFFFGILAFTSDLLSLPLDIYHTFVIEERFEFNKTTPKTFVIDKFKGWLLAALVGGGILALIVFIYEKSGSWFWVLAWMSISFFTLFISYFYTTLLVPIFNKLTPLPAGELRDAIEQVALRADFSLKDISIMDGSKRSTHGNAYFSGFGRKKSIVLFDTLVNEHSVDELAAVLAHEIGHYKKKHVLKGLLTGVLQTGVLLFVLSIMLKSPIPALALGASVASFHMSLIAFGILYSPVSMVLGIILNFISRKHEYEADRFAIALSKPGALQEALKRLSVKNLSNLTPHPWYVFIHYSHPALLQRLAAINKDGQS
ncbi:MAG: M48 family metallopeptidase [Lentimicrobiaceae bacterium]|jgi:STE24 endopeptidase